MNKYFWRNVGLWVPIRSLSTKYKILKLPHAVLSTVSTIIFLHYCHFLIKDRKYKINYSQPEQRLKAGLFTHGWTEEQCASILQFFIFKRWTADYYVT